MAISSTKNLNNTLKTNWVFFNLDSTMTNIYISKPFTHRSLSDFTKSLEMVAIALKKDLQLTLIILFKMFHNCKSMYLNIRKKNYNFTSCNAIVYIRQTRLVILL